MREAIAVTVPTYNRAPSVLERAVTSALAAGADLVVVWDDGSDPPVPARLVDPSRVVVTGTPGAGGNHGVPFAFNNALRVALMNGPTWIARFASDDYMAPGKLRVQVEAMRSYGHRATFHDCTDGNTGKVYDTGMPTRRSWPHVNRARWRSALRRTNRFAGTTSVIAAEDMATYLDEGGHPEQLTYCHDWYLNAWVEHEVNGGWQYLLAAESWVEIGRDGEGLEARSHADPHGQWCRDECARMIKERWG